MFLLNFFNNKNLNLKMKEKDTSYFILKQNIKCKQSPNIILEEEENNNHRIFSYSHKKGKKDQKFEKFPLIILKSESKNNVQKNVREDSYQQSSKGSQKSSTLKRNLNNEFKLINDGRFNTDIDKEKNIFLDNNDSSYFENHKICNNKNNLDQNKIMHSNTINSYFYKSMYACKNRKKTNDSETLNDIFNQLLDIKHKIKYINFQKNNKISQFNSSLSNISKKSSEKINFKLSNYNNNQTFSRHNYHNCTSYDKKMSSFTSNIKTPRNIKSLKRTKSLKPNINIVNFRKSANIYRRFNEHIKYILHIRENEMISLANQFQKALEDNEKEKAVHYKNRIFPLEIIERINKIKGDLTLNKYRNEYFKRIDRYDIHPLRKFLDNEKKNVKANKVKIFKGIFSSLVNLK